MQTLVQQAVMEHFTGLPTRVRAALIMPFDSTVLAYGKVLQFGPGSSRHLLRQAVILQRQKWRPDGNYKPPWEASCHLYRHFLDACD
jgi:hypothetical protein